MPSPARHRAALALWLAGVSLLALLLAVLHFATTFPYVTLEGLAAFAEPEPFQRRVLMPWLAAGLGQVGTGGPASVRFLVLEATGWAALVGVAWWLLGMLRGQISPAGRRLLALTVVLPVGVQLMLPARYRVYAGDAVLGDLTTVTEPFTRITALPGLYFPYDLPAAVFLLALVGALWRLADAPSRTAWTGYGLLVAVATLNRETTLLIVPLAIWTLRHRLGPGPLAWMAAAHVAGILAILLALRALLDLPQNPRSGHPGGLEWYLWTNLRTLGHPAYAASALLPLAAGAWLVPLMWWRDVPPRLRALVVLYAGPAFLVALLFGIVLETRVFTEVAAALWLAAVGTLLALRRPDG